MSKRGFELTTIGSRARRLIPLGHSSIIIINLRMSLIVTGKTDEGEKCCGIFLEIGPYFPKSLKYPDGKNSNLVAKAFSLFDTDDSGIAIMKRQKVL